MTLITRSLLTASFLLSVLHLSSQTIHHVNTNVQGGNNDGTTWPNAYSDLQDGLAEAQYGDSVWVAQGTYFPTTSTDRNISFELKNGVKMFGGFIGVETALEQRDWATNPTILSGDIGVPGDSTDNSYTILYIGTSDTTTLVDGLVLMHGTANGTTGLTYNPTKSGSAIYISGENSYAYPRLWNCRFENNFAVGYGGAVYVVGDNNCSSSFATTCAKDYSQCACNGSNITITPYKNIQPLDGVTTFDLVLISKHILGLTPLDSPYKIIAADANKSNSVTTFDLVEIRKLILFINLEFPSNTSWRFVDASYVFPNPNNPFSPPFPECIDLDFSNGAMPSPPAANFVAIKIGDVNNSHSVCTPFTGGQVGERGQSRVEMFYRPNNPEMMKGGEFVVDFYLNGKADLAAWQAGLLFDPVQLEFLEVLPSELDGMNIGNFGLTEAKDGKLRALWYERYAGTVAFHGNAPVFSLRFKANRDISDMAGLFSLDDDVLFGAAYESDGSANNLNLEYKANAAGLSRLPLEDILSVTTAPNPFRDELRLTVALKEAAYVDVTIYDALGRVVATWNEYTEPGQREIVLNKTSRWGLGVFTWQVKTDKQSQSGKVVRE